MYDVETARLYLRPLEPEDLDVYYERIFADPEVTRTLPSGQPVPRDAFDARIYQALMVPWEQHGFGPWIAIHKEDDEVVGHCGLRYWPESPEVELLYALARSWWGRGLATEAARASLRSGFEHLDLKSIMAAAKVDNFASRRVLEKCGMRFEGTFMFLGLEAARYGISREELPMDGSPYRLIPWSREP